MKLPSRLRRVRSMNRHEFAWRVFERVQTSADRMRSRIVRPRWHPQRLAAQVRPLDAALIEAARALRRGDIGRAHVELVRHFRAREPRFILHGSVRERLRSRVLDRHPGAMESAVRTADRVVTGMYDLLGYEELRFGSGAPDWHLDPVSQRRAPRRFWADVDYLSPSLGDHKVIWELNRHQEWLQLGRAAWLSNEGRFKDAFASQLESWMRSNPPGLGINWASALELAFRSLSWLWALELFAPASPHDAADQRPWLVHLLLGLDRQLRHVERHLSRYFSPNTHLLGEALALYVCGRALPELASADRWARTGQRVLLEESARQVLPDGAHAERSTHYHRYALDFYLLALAVARLTGDWTMATSLQPVVQSMAAFMRDVCDDMGRYPLIGDDDGGELVPVAGRTAGDARASLWWAACALDEPSLRAGAMPEAVLWLTATGAGGPARIEDAARQAPRGSASFPAAGYYVSRRGRSHLVFDAGRHGYLNGGHAHADALALTLSLDGRPLLVDSGTATYTMDPETRDHFRSSQAHNTVTLDGRSQSRPAGPFHWRSSVDAAAGRVVLGTAFDYFEGRIALGEGLRHERSILSLDGDCCVIADRIAGTGIHEAAVHWHVAPEWHATHERAGGIRLVHRDGGEARLALTGARIEMVRADAAGRIGWVSPVYGRTVPATLLLGRATGRPPLVIGTLVGSGARDAHVPLRFAELLGADERDGSVAFLAEDRDSLHVTLFGSDDRETRTVLLDPRRGLAMTTDARVLHARVTGDGRLVRACAVDCAILRFEGRHGVTALALEPVPDFDLSIDPTGACRVASTAGTHRIDVRVDAGEPPVDYAPAAGPGGSAHVRHRGIR